MSRAGQRRAGKVRLTHQEKILYPETGFTKGDLLEYYRAVAPVLLPHLKDTAVTLKRYPHGVGEKFFFTKRCPANRPEWMQTCRMPTVSVAQPLNYCVIDSLDALLWAANQDTIELHPVLFTRRHVERPRFVVFDLDPGPPAGMAECITLALRIREELEHRNIASYPKVSGGKGLHLYIPLNTAVTFEQTRLFARALARFMEMKCSDLAITNMKKELRTGKVLIDWSQNHQHKTTASVYTLRARNRPAVSMPVEWDELRAALRRGVGRSLVSDAGQAINRIDARGDLFAEVLTLKQRLPDAASIRLS